LAWALVQPVIQVLVFSVFFGNFLGVGDRVNEAAGRPVPYPLFAMTGQIIWNFFSGGVTGASNSLIANATIIRKIYVPRLVLPLAALGKPALDSLIVFVLMVGLTVWYTTDPNYDIWLTPKLALSPLILVGAAVPAFGLGLILAALTVSYRDLRHALPFLIQTLFYATPVIYPAKVLSGPFERLIYLNPIAGFVQAHRGLAMDLPVDWVGLGISATVSLALVVFGLFFFARVERHFADVA
jgi:lipopolysaccharide transport system permease protein